MISVFATACTGDDAPSSASGPIAVDASGTPSGTSSVGSSTVLDSRPATEATVAETGSTVTSGPCTVDYEVISTRPHDANAFTQGLVVDGDVLHESTGLYGESTVRTVDPISGDVLRSTSLPVEHFGEGLTLFDDRLYQLTWREGVVHVYDRSLTRVETRSWPGEGWGLTTDGTDLILSDGTPTLHWIDPATWTTSRTVTVIDEGQPVALLNELELVDGAVLANVWMTPLVAVIDPSSGEVTGWLDLTSLLPDPASLTDPSQDVLNGVALDPTTGHLFVTGKRWPTLYELDVDRSCWPVVANATP